MRRRNLRLALGNVRRVAWNLVAKQYRRITRRFSKGTKHLRETAKDVRSGARGMVDAGQDATAHAYAGAVRTKRYWQRVQVQTIPRLTREMSVRRELRAAARGNGPIIVGPWLSEVGYEALYWIPFLRWFRDRYQVDPSRLVVVSRGGVASWYRGIADHYVELLELFDTAQFAARNAERQRAGEQKQQAIADFDWEILNRVRSQSGLAAAAVCHPSAMFRLLRQFWLGNDSLQHVQEHTRYALMDPPPMPALPALPERFVATKFYTGKAIPDTERHRQQLREVVEQLAARSPIVSLDTGLALDEHQDYLFKNIPGVTSLAGVLTPQNNLGLQTDVIRRASAFVGTCGGVAWLAPFLGTDTFAIYADDELLTPHLYAARQAYRDTGAAPFTAVDLRTFELAGMTQVAANSTR